VALVNDLGPEKEVSGLAARFPIFKILLVLERRRDFKDEDEKDRTTRLWDFSPS
jgi:hypothetical protein